MFRIFLDFVITFVISTGWVFFPLFLVGGTAWYLVIDIYSRILQLKELSFISKKKNGFSLRKPADEGSTSHLFKKFLREERNHSKEGFERYTHGVLKDFYQDIRTVSVLAGVAPLLGLLGTVTGMMNTFEIISLYGNSNPTLMAGGISEAMLTTQIGLLISFPLLLVVARIRGRLNKLKSRWMKDFVSI